MGSGLSFIFLLFLSTISSIYSESTLKLPSEKDITGAYCDSWRLAVETNNAGAWGRVPASCVGFVKEYMYGDHYWRDIEVVGNFSSAFAKSVGLGEDGRDAWVFDIDETLLSNLQYYADVDFGSALQASLKLYKELQELGFKIFLLTGRSEYQRNATEINLLLVGYRNWERLILRGSSDQGKPATSYKSEKRAELVNEGYRIHGSSGDQWSDLWGYAVASRSFKLPNPMYYIH
ncbi:acid phosphatase 1-like [Abrus precatorius]|uniref:Acid phosphatase 1-like n=1 Tax=Abrus precatorius TaxID=3816 RepID=A0A8B8LLZ0_ABRPR|nr:acid phosphatase 1-like [Abrus precatorius]